MVETGHQGHDRISHLVNWAHWFTFFNIILVSLISLRYISYAGISSTFLGVAYQLLSLVGHFSFLAGTLFIIVLFPLAFFIKSQRFYRALAILISAISVTFLIIDTQIFRLYDFHLNPLIWRFLQQPEQVEQIYAINLHYISFPIILIVEFAISFFAWRKARKLQATKKGKMIGAFLVSAFVLTHLTYIWADATQYRPITQQKSLYPLSYPMTARTFLKKQGWLSDDALLDNIANQDTSAQNNLNYPLETLSYLDPKTTTEKKNVLFITIGEIRADVLNADDMPHLYKISQQGLNFQNHFSGSHKRELGLFSLFYGIPNRYWSEITLNYIPPVMMTRFNEENYHFGLFSSIGMLSPEFSQSSFSELNSLRLRRFSQQESNSKMTSDWLNWEEKQTDSNPWFSFLYFKPEKKELLQSSRGLSINARTKRVKEYHQQLTEIDQQIERIVRDLRHKDILKNTVVVITGTHGASFEKQSSIESSIYNAHVPLVILWPNQTPRSITRMTSHLDIVPTIMEEVLFTKTEAHKYTSGQSLFDNSERPYVLSGDRKQFVIYEKDKITQFSSDGEMKSIQWDGASINSEQFDITLLIDVLKQLRQFNK